MISPRHFREKILNMNQNNTNYNPGKLYKNNPINSQGFQYKHLPCATVVGTASLYSLSLPTHPLPPRPLPWARELPRPPLAGPASVSLSFTLLVTGCPSRCRKLLCNNGGCQLLCLAPKLNPLYSNTAIFPHNAKNGNFRYFWHGLLKTVPMYTNSLVVLMFHFVNQKCMHNLADILCSIPFFHKLNSVDPRHFWLAWTHYTHLEWQNTDIHFWCEMPLWPQELMKWQ
jgi:hypothetical protein